MPKQSFNGDILHCNAVRMRITGSGTLVHQLNSLDEILSDTVVPITMSPTTYIEPTQLANFENQRMSLEFGVTEIDEYFTISRITIFIKPIATEYPR